MKQKILFRADAGEGIGYGHFIRTLALADMLKGDFECLFYTQTPSEYQVNELKGVCRYVALPSDDSKFQIFLDCLGGSEIVVLDNYFYTTNYQKRIKAKGCKLVCIDDLHDKHFVADLIINQAINVIPEDYSCESYTKFAFGLGYSLLRKPFFEARKKWENKHPQKNKEALDVVVAFGGSDFLDLTGKVIRAIEDMSVVKGVTAMIGDSYSSERVIESSKICYRKNLSAQEIVELFTNSDVAILPSSTIMIEAFACGISIIGGYYVHNQENDYYAYLLANMITGVGDYSDVSSLRKLKEALSRVSEKNVNVITAETPHRFVELFKELKK